MPRSDLSGSSSQLRPDIYLKSPDGKTIILADVTVPYENGMRNMQRAWQEKIDKYEGGFGYLRKLGKRLTVLPIVVGSLGTWWKPTTDSLVQLGIDKSTVRRVIPEICSMTMEYSKNVYWNHMYGDSFSKPPMKFGGEKPKGNGWKNGEPGDRALVSTD